MIPMLIALLSFGIGAMGAIVFAGRGRGSTICGVAGVVVGCACGIIPAVSVALGEPSESIRMGWDVPYGSLFLELDPLSGFFLIPVFVLCALAAIYGADYLEACRGRKSLAPPWFFFNLLVASMVVVILARNGVLFLMAWEMVALSSFFLVTFEDEIESTRQAGWTYLVASHIGTAFLLALFILLGRANGSLDFDRFSPSPSAGLLFGLALVGFGTKAGFIPLHVWLPEAHPAAPSHVSAVMSAVMIKTGIYGLIRVMMLLGTPQAWWGWVLCAIGLSSGVIGVLLALAQHDLKRLLAYCSVENVGIIALGLGVGVIGLRAGLPAVAAIGFAGALLHVLNHALFKGMLFMAAGNVLHNAHTRVIDHLGGLMQRMPRTGAIFLIGAAAISGLPPLNGFISEFLIYLASFKGAVTLDGVGVVPMLAAIAGLALIGGLAAACFTKAFGIVFLGQPRSQQAENAHEAGPAMVLPGFVLATACVLIGLLGAYVVNSMAPLISEVTGLSTTIVRANLRPAAHSIVRVNIAVGALVGIAAFLAIGRTITLSKRLVSTNVTWDCGYAAPSPRMQYTASSFAQPLTNTFDLLLQTHRVVAPLHGLFPKEASLATETPDPYQEHVYQPLFREIGRNLLRLRPLQQGQVQLYISYIGVTLLLLLLWQLA